MRRAKELGRTLMVDHTYVYSPAVKKIKSIVDSGDLGDIYYIDSVRINLGLFQNDINVLWDLAPHDLSIIDRVLGRLPRSVGRHGRVAHLQRPRGYGLSQPRFWRVADGHVPRQLAQPVKVRHTIIGGSKRNLVYNDLDPVEPLKIYDCGIQVGQSSEAR